MLNTTALNDLDSLYAFIDAALNDLEMDFQGDA